MPADVGGTKCRELCRTGTLAYSSPRQRICFSQPRNGVEVAMTVLRRLLLTLGLFAMPTASLAQDNWPERPITLVVPYAPGGYTDLVGRLTARYMEKALGKSVIV